MMKPSGPEAQVVLVKWYDFAKWLLERVENYPKSQRFVLGQRIAGQSMDILELLVSATYAGQKAGILADTNRKIEVLRWTIRMCKDRKLLTPAQFEFSARALNECGKMVGGWWKQSAKGRDGEDTQEHPAARAKGPMRECGGRWSTRGGT